MKKYLFIIFTLLYINFCYSQKKPNVQSLVLPGGDCITGVISSLSFGYNGGTQTISFLASCDWNSSDNASWISLSNNYSLDRITVTCASNPNFTSRTGTITVESLSSSEVHYITVTQSARPCTPTIYTLSGSSTSKCEGDASSTTLTLNDSEVGVNYDLKDGSTLISTKAGTGSALSWSVTPATVGTHSYSVVAERVSPSCEVAMNGTVNITVNPKPIAYSLVKYGDICNGYYIKLSNCEGGVTYQLKRDGAVVETVSVHDFEGGVVLNFGFYTSVGTYSVLATDDVSGCTNTMSNTTSISAPPVSGISTPSSKTICENESVTFSVSGTNINSYQWQEKIIGHDFINISGATSSSYTMTNVSDSKNGYQYRCVGQGTCETKTSGAATLTVNSLTDITTQPISKVICENSSAVFSITATGTSLTYIWQRYNGSTWSNITGATSSSYTVSNASYSLNGYKYRCIVTGTCGIETSSSATLTVNKNTVITNQPVDDIVCEGSSASFSITATGTSLTYIWQSYNGSTWSNITGATSSSYTVSNAPYSLNGYKYRCVVTGTCGIETSSSATLTVNKNTVITNQPVDDIVCEGSPASFGITATGTSLTYIWQSYNGSTWSNITGATSSSYTVSNAPYSLNGYKYRCIATGTCGIETSNSATLTVNKNTVITNQPVDDIVCEGSPASFSVTATGTSLTYIWKEYDSGYWNDIVGETDPDFSIPNAEIPGKYMCQVSGTCGDVLSNQALLSVKSSISIGTQPVNEVACENTNAVFTVLASGSGTINYQWQTNETGSWVDITGTNNSSYTLPSVSLSKNGTDYRCVLSGDCNTVVSNSATLTVNKNTIITNQPVDNIVCEGSPASFSVTATGTSLTYIWQRYNGITWSSITGATGTSYTVSNAPYSLNGYKYRCMVTGACGIETSSSATLTVNKNTVITNQPVDDIVCEGSPASFSITATGTSLTYLWQSYNGSTWSNITGATSTSYTVSNAPYSLNGYKYRCIVTGTCGIETSSSATLTVNKNTVITNQPVDDIVCEGSPASFSITATGTSLTYIWKEYDSGYWNDIAGKTDPDFSIANAEIPGKYRCQVSGACGDVLSNEALLSVKSSISIGTQPVNEVVCENTNAEFTVQASGSGTINCQWQTNETGSWADIAGANNPSYTLPTVSLSKNGTGYRCVLNGDCNTVVSDSATLTVNQNVAITSQLVTDPICNGEDVSISISAVGTELTFLWYYFDGQIWTEDTSPDATKSSLTLQNIAYSDNGNQYKCEVTGVCGIPVTSSVVTLNVTQEILIPVQPQAINALNGETDVFTIEATGENIQYQWKKDGVILDGETAANCSIPYVNFDDEGYYHCVVSDQCFDIESNSVFLNAIPVDITAHWKMDGNVNDASANKMHGVVNGPILCTDKYGNKNRAFAFAGDDHIEFTNVDALSSEVGSISFWIKPGGVNMNIFRFSSDISGESSTEDYISGSINASGELSLIIEDENLEKVHVSYNLNQLESGFIGEWLHVVWTQKGNGVKLFLNGDEVSLNHITDANSAWWSSHLDITKASIGEIGGNLNASIDDFRVYGYALATAEIDELYNDNNWGSFVGYWPFNGNANDASIGTNNGIVNGASLTLDRFGNKSSAYSFDGINDYITNNLSADLGMSNFSISFWMKSNGSIGKSFLSIGDHPGIVIDHTDNDIRCLVEDGDENIISYTNVISNIDFISDWIHVVLIVNRDQDILFGYYNGVKTGQLDISNLTGNFNGISGMTIGTYTDYFDGKLDDIRIYDKALSDNDVLNLFNIDDPNQIIPAFFIDESEDENFVRVSNPVEAYTELPEDGNYKSIEEINYFDGLGRKYLGVQVAASPMGKDVIQYINYDSLGREPKKYLPYVSNYVGGFYRNDAAAEQEAFYNPLTVPENIADDLNPWADMVFEESPLNRVLEQGAPGTAWQTNGIDADNAVHFAHQTNASEVKLFDVDSTSNLFVNGDYPAASLYKTGTRDENEVWSYEYKNKHGQVLLKVSDPTGLNLKTYYVYDDYGLLRYIIPPRATDEIGTQSAGSIDQNIINNLCFYYKYDNRNRMTIKKLPGANEVYLVYDERDRLVLTQDGNLRDSNEWMFTKYDMLNRPIINGLYKHDTLESQTAMQSIVNADSNYYETINGDFGGGYFGYTNQAFPLLDLDDEILSVSYYDNYNFDETGVYNYLVSTDDETDYPANLVNNKVKGQVTGTLTKILDAENLYLMAVNLYDDKYRVIRTYSDNYLGGNDVTLTKYDFNGNVLKTKQIHYKDADATTPIIINQRFDYDHAFRLKEVYHQIGENPDDEILMAELEYNELGQLVKKKLNENEDSSFLQEIDYEYNIRGWLTKINDPANIANDEFAMQLAYNEDIGLTTNYEFNGNISAMKWINKSETVEHGYAFNYDDVNRLTNANHFENGSDILDFDLELVDYDANGNIEILKRYGDLGVKIDELTYNYGDTSINYTNQLQLVADASANADGFNDSNAGIDYAYDNNGNLIEDKNKGIISITYNYLNLPEEIDFGGGNLITYIYDAAGVKHAKKVTDASAGIDYKYYMGNMEYNNAKELEYIHTDEGRVRLAGIDYIYDYYLKDHLGNTRVVFNEGAGTIDVEQVDNYYPFGMRFNQSDLIADQTTDYMYNGKELQKDHNLDWYDYGARMYDAAIGRWHVPDPLAEKFSHVSPYVYAMNNPICVIDRDGKQSWPIAKYWKGDGRQITSNFGNRMHPIHKVMKPHNGVDMDYSGNDLGAPIYATHDGKIVKVKKSNTGGGNRITIQSPDGSFQTFYMHLDKFADGIAVGKEIKEGDQIGTMGNTGGSTGAHLHYGMKEKQADGTMKAVNPMDKNGNLIDPQERVEGSEQFKAKEEINQVLEWAKEMKNGNITPDEFYNRVEDLNEKREDDKK